MTTSSKFRFGLRRKLIAAMGVLAALLAAVAATALLSLWNVQENTTKTVEVEAELRRHGAGIEPQRYAGELERRQRDPADGRSGGVHRRTPGASHRTTLRRRFTPERRLRCSARAGDSLRLRHHP